MEFIVSTATTIYEDAEHVLKLEDLGFKFKSYTYDKVCKSVDLQTYCSEFSKIPNKGRGRRKVLMWELLEPKQVKVDIASLDDLRRFSEWYGGIVLNGEFLIIFDGHIA